MASCSVSRGGLSTAFLHWRPLTSAYYKLYLVTRDASSTVPVASNIMQREFPIRGWLWVPYKCHYHYYNVSDINKCAKEKKIKWILMLGGSLSLCDVQVIAILTNQSQTPL